MISAETQKALGNLISAPAYSVVDFEEIYNNPDLLEEYLDGMYEEEWIPPPPTAAQARKGPDPKKSAKQKSLAESQYVQPQTVKSLDSYFEDLNLEALLFKDNPFDKIQDPIETEEVKETPLAHEEEIISELLSAQIIASKEDLFEYNLNDLFYLDPSQDNIDSSEIENSIPINKSNDEQPLFIKRRLFSSIKKLDLSDHSFVTKNFQTKKSLNQVDISKLFDQDDFSFQFIRENFSKHIKHKKIFSFLTQQGQLDLRSVKKLFSFDKHRKFQMSLVLAYVLFNDKKFFKKMNTKIGKLNPVFQHHPFKDLDLRSAFTEFGLSFFDEFLNFKVAKASIAPILILRYKMKYKDEPLRNEFFIQYGRFKFFIK